MKLNFFVLVFSVRKETMLSAENEMTFGCVEGWKEQEVFGNAIDGDDEE